MPFSPLHLLLVFLLISFLIVFIQVGALTLAVEKLGLSPESAAILLFGSLFGSLINLPLFSITAQRPPESFQGKSRLSLLRPPQRPFHGKTIIAVNAGGCLIPLTFSLYLFQNSGLELSQALLGIAAVSTVSYLFSRPIPGMGIGMPIFIAPLSAALAAQLITPEYRAPLAYIAGTLGVLLGADIFRLKDVRRMGTPIASIGGAGTFDGIFITGIIAVLLA
ncbi:protein of unknown function DUF1614 [Nitrosococcus halophilus Nc 4]|uniref:DUF1614 domain-containing protein n=1 Tax=Nitrosococcus halophilus (strain Nc4) TaxID=472759 RepID=D5C3G4_NITHN|nr:DUF1614 domain-containing protein [Nitrosococcus halophilus]ADE16871.1 protein of unknown function DUF1614 [Nitrosococcus halophilus Nc 4]